tara:strand:- start:14519 stop:14920 length:402 start_codon:yes stop_codon:yes gene_type:complete
VALEKKFKLDKILENDCFLIKDLELSKLLLMNNKLYPWLILVPQRPDMMEIIDLNCNDQQTLLKEINYVSKIIKNIYKPDKLNIANLGNIVSQLHIHIIARYKNDNSFPKPVWIDNNRTYYNNKDIENIRQYF